MKKNSASADTAESPEQLIENLRTLITEAEKTLGATFTEGAEDQLGDLRERLESARDKAQSLFEGARQKVTAGAKQADATIRSHPYESLAVALGVGVLLGALLRRSN
ncbi:MAG TPA: hypothetical protein VL357_07920 [Rariglobus sp.]|jgi:ElaB/YqjD/DUF883 family membrane-anchored ribosome-binding protein|nr:hypothetical protein [Rariglobus sp.]